MPVKRLNSVDLPTLGRPTITRDGNFCGILFGIETLTRLPLERGVQAIGDRLRVRTVVRWQVGWLEPLPPGGFCVRM